MESSDDPSADEVGIARLLSPAGPKTEALDEMRARRQQRFQLDVACPLASRHQLRVRPFASWAGCGATYTRFMRSDEELRELSEHLLYEVEMLFGTANVLLADAIAEESAQLSTTIRNAVLESFVVHFRALQEFFWFGKPRFETDARAADFFEGEAWAEIRRPQETTIEDGPLRAGREIVHLTYLRNTERRPWMVAQIAASVGRCFRLFLGHVDRAKIAEDFEVRLRACWPGFLDFPIAVSYPADHDPPGVATTSAIPASQIARWGPLG